MFRMGIKDVEFIICNTDAQALKASPIPVRLQIGTTLTEGLGCGANPEVGRAAAVESQELIKEALQGAKMVFITAGMGGGTGTGAAPVIAKIAREMGILTVGIVTMPFEWEGKKKIQQAQHGVNGLKENCDTVLVILNSRLREMFGNLPIRHAFAEADNVLTTAAKGIAEIITLAGYVNVDFQDVRTVMKDAGAAVMGSAETKGDDRALNAARLALASPLLDNREIMGAKRILLSIISGEEAELQMDELSLITNYIQEQAGDRCEVIFGHGIDENLGTKIRVTVIATGFHDARRQRPRRVERTVIDLDSPAEITGPVIIDAPVQEQEIRMVEEPVAEKPEMKSVQAPENNSYFDDQPQQAEPADRSVNQPSVQQMEEEILPREKESSAPIIFSPGLFDDIAQTPPSTEPGWCEPGQFSDNQDERYVEFEISAKTDGHEDNQTVNPSDIMESKKTRERLQAQAQARREKISASRRQEMSREEFHEKWSQPAFERRGVKMDSVPHSAQSNISRFNLNDDNQLLGNNRFLHDNVD